MAQVQQQLEYQQLYRHWSKSIPWELWLPSLRPITILDEVWTYARHLITHTIVFSQRCDRWMCQPQVPFTLTNVLHHRQWHGWRDRYFVSLVNCIQQHQQRFHHAALLDVFAEQADCMQTTPFKYQLWSNTASPIQPCQFSTCRCTQNNCPNHHGRQHQNFLGIGRNILTWSFSDDPSSSRWKCDTCCQSSWNINGMQHWGQQAPRSRTIQHQS